MEELIAPTCKHADELIAFLYGELNKVESRAFAQHLQACDLCNQEFAAFSNIRSSVVAWRNESLGRISSRANLPYATPAATRTRPSALAALREFFSLSPVWLKGGVAFATLVFCLLAGLSLARLRDSGPVSVADNSPAATSTKGTTYSDQQLNALVNQRVQDELRRINSSTNGSSAPQTAASHSVNSPTRRMAVRNDAVAASLPARRPLSKVEREQLAADLRLVAVNSDVELELLDDRINQ